MQARWLPVLLLLLSGCQAVEGTGVRSRNGGVDGDAVAILAKLLPGEYDNHEQVVHAAAGSPQLRIQHDLRVVDHGSDHVDWLWRLRASTATQSLAGIWFLRAQYAHSGHQLRIVPYRPLDAAAANAAFSDSSKPFRFVAEQWAELAPCGLDANWDGTKFSATANVEACSALLPGLGEVAALLPLRLTIDGEMLRVATFSDSSRGPGAIEEARRTRWFEGWAAVNGGGPLAKVGNQDWHFDRSVRLSSEGGRASLHWRDGAPSGYSLELEHTSYPERKLSVLQLNVIDDATGKVLTYAWTDPQSSAIGLNLGWLQVGLGASAGAPAGK